MPSVTSRHARLQVLTHAVSVLPPFAALSRAQPRTYDRGSGGGFADRRCKAGAATATMETMKVDGSLTDNLGRIANRARELEAAGYDGAHTFEGPHDPFAARAPRRRAHRATLELATAIAVAFARNPMTLAQTAYDLQSVLEGPLHPRSRLARSSPHIEKRFSMPWSQTRCPHARARARDPRHLGVLARRRTAAFRRRVLPPHADDPVLPLRARTRTGHPRLWLAGVGPAHDRSRRRGRATGSSSIPSAPERFLREVTLPALSAARPWRIGRATGSRSRSQLMIVTGDSDDEIEAAERGPFAASSRSTARRRPTGACSTLHGWGDLQPRAQPACPSKARWEEMGGLIGDELVDTSHRAREAGGDRSRVLARHGDLIDRISFNAPYRADPARWTENWYSRVQGGRDDGGFADRHRRRAGALADGDRGVQ